MGQPVGLMSFGFCGQTPRYGRDSQPRSSMLWKSRDARRGARPRAKALSHKMPDRMQAVAVVRGEGVGLRLRLTANWSLWRSVVSSI